MAPDVWLYNPNRPLFLKLYVKALKVIRKHISFRKYIESFPPEPFLHGDQIFSHFVFVCNLRGAREVIDSLKLIEPFVKIVFGGSVDSEDIPVVRVCINKP